MRYARHLSLQEIGEAGQARLASARVLVIGTGGLGSPALLYLAAAGVGTIGIVDDDIVDLSNLQRQILFTEKDIGQRKANVAPERLLTLNSEINVTGYDERFTIANALDLIREYDLVLDGSDNFATRYLANDASVIAGIPLISGSINRFAGQVSVFATSDGPCYRCLFPEMPDPALVPSCAEAGVLGVLPGVIGSVMATEAIKLICKRGEPLIGRLLRYDALTMHFSELRFERDADCPACGNNRRMQLLNDYEFSCEIDSIEVDRVPEDALIVDVRELSEYRARPSIGKLMPMSTFAHRIFELPREQPIAIVCAVGARSLHAARLLRDHGFERAYSLRGGLAKHPTVAQATVAQAAADEYA